MDPVREREKFIIHIMNQGFQRASDAFSSFIGKSVKITNTQSVLVRHANDFSCISDEDGEIIVLVTKLIGDLSGKSYLILNADETTEIVKITSQTFGFVSHQLNDALLMEIDNIISASVISELSNNLKLEVYGDVPLLKRMKADELEDFMEKEVEGMDRSSMILSNTTFQFNVNERVHPQFLWKLSSKIFESVPHDRIHLAS